MLCLVCRDSGFDSAFYGVTRTGMQSAVATQLSMRSQGPTRVFKDQTHGCGEAIGTVEAPLAD